jgi:arginine/lysine/ornithine decarboxylase
MQMATEGREHLSTVILLSRKAREAIRQMNGLWCYGDELIGVKNIFAFDPSKLIVRVSDAGFSGFEAHSLLRQQYDVEVEFADLKHVIFSITIADTESTIDKLLNALHDLTRQKHQTINHDDSSIKPLDGQPLSAISLRDAYFATKTHTVPLNEAIGHILAENIIPYPPGIPLLVPGEIMEQRHFEYLCHLIDKGGTIVGMEDSSLRTVRIVDGNK